MARDAAEQRPAAAPARLEWLDLYRGAAVLVMIETHVVNTFLTPALRTGEWFARLNYFNGLVAPAFLFIAGYAHGLGMRRAQTRRGGVWRRLWRLAGIAALGFALHLPWKELVEGRWSEALRLGTQVNILPCLAVAIGTLVAIERVTDRWARIVIAAMAACVVILAPLAALWTSGPVPLVAWLNRSTGSFFPLLPWAAFAWIGCLLSARPPHRPKLMLAVLGAVLAVAVLGRADLSPVSAAFFFERLAWIIAFVPVCAWLAPRWTPRTVLFAGQESLVMYVAHLIVIAALAGLGIGSVGIALTAGLYAIVLAATFAATWGWRRVSSLKRR